MACDHQEFMEKVLRELLGGYDLNARLLALLGHYPLDSRGQEAAMAISQELSKVFMRSLFMLKPDDGRVVGEARTAPEVRTGDCGIGLRAPAKDKRICGEDVGQLRKGREEEVTRKEITPSPHKDGYQWRKYGQKSIRNRKFERYYYKCALSRARRCRAKKQVQEQDSSTDAAPMFKVTYVNEHTCQHALSDDDEPANLPPPPLPPAATTTASGPSQWGSGAVEENEAIVSCLSKVISGAAPSPSLPATPAVEPLAYVPAGGRYPPIQPDGTMVAAEMDFSMSYGPSFYSPLGVADQLIDHCDVCDVHVDPGSFMGTESMWAHRDYAMWN